MVKINTHLRTTNVYVQRQIIRDNISRLRNFMLSRVFQILPYPMRKEYKHHLKMQKALLNHVNKKINAIEQTSFGFGDVSSSL